jgi:hypothetical protein
MGGAGAVLRAARVLADTPPAGVEVNGKARRQPKVLLFPPRYPAQPTSLRPASPADPLHRGRMQEHLAVAMGSCFPSPSPPVFNAPSSTSPPPRYSPFCPFRSTSSWPHARALCSKATLRNVPIAPPPLPLLSQANLRPFSPFSPSRPLRFTSSWPHGRASRCSKAKLLCTFFPPRPYEPVRAGEEKNEKQSLFSIAIASRPRAPDAG